MQTLHLRFQALRAISSGETPSRWPTPSVARCAGTKGPPGLSHSPGPTYAVGSRPELSHQRFDRGPTVGAGLTMVSPFREPRVVGPVGANTSRVCPRQTATVLTCDPAHQTAGDHRSVQWQARASEALRATSHGLSFPLRLQPRGGRASGEKTADPAANVVALAGVSSGACRQRCERALRQRLRRGAH